MKLDLRLGGAALGVAALGLALSGCAGWQSALDPHGLEAVRLKDLIWLFVATCGAVWLVVMVTLALALLRRRKTAREGGSKSRDRGLAFAVGAALTMTVLIITGLTFASYVATRGISDPGRDALTLRVRGYQWWWEVTYLDADPSRVLMTANEIHVPVGRRVHIQLVGADVIHSFWVPSLIGKMDMIPGRNNEITFTAQRAGVYRGQCAEFCGLQHAHMGFLVVADEPDDFDKWRDAQLDEAPAPPSGEAEAGRAIVESKACAACHTVRGTSAAGTLGPDLTHVASRQTIAAGLLPTTRGSLAAWIADPQTIKPGNNMPMIPLTAEDLRAVSAYLAGLQ